jgi:hypothetical protein
MKLYLVNLLLLIFGFSTSYTQTGPAGVGQNNGTTSLKIWYRTDFGVSTTGTSINSVTNAAGVAALNISEAGAQRPTLVTGAVNGYDEMNFSGSNRLRTGLTLTTTNFVNDEASSFVVCRAGNTTQTSCVYTTDPLVSSTRFTNHIPWSNTVYFDIGTCCGTDARIQVGGLTGLNNYSVWSYDALPATGKQLYRNGTLLQSRANTTVYNSHASHRFNIGGNTSGTNGFVGDVTEIIIFNNKINSAQRIIIENYLAAKYGITTATNDVFDEDNAVNGNYDHDVAGIGRVDASNIHNDAQGTGIVRILNPSGLNNNEFLMWGHDNAYLGALEKTDVPPGVQARFNRVWRASEVNTSNTAVDVGSIDIRWDLTGLGPVTASDLRLLVDTDNDGIFSDETPISGATSLGANVYQFAGVTAIANNLRFTLATINSIQTPLPVELINFNAQLITSGEVKLDWQTASETNNKQFIIQRSIEGYEWENIKTVDGAGNSSVILDYVAFDNKPHSGLNYYRLKQIDFNGKFQYSEIKTVNIKNEKTHIYPNPSNNIIYIESVDLKLEDIYLYNMIGQNLNNIISMQRLSDTKIEIHLERVPNGVYFINTNANFYKFIKE